MVDSDSFNEHYDKHSSFIGYLLPDQILFRSLRINNISRVKQRKGVASNAAVLCSDLLKKSAKSVK